MYDSLSTHISIIIQSTSPHSYKHQPAHTQQICIAAEQGEMKCESVFVFQ